jgi:C1A family cysteine protease
MKKIIKKAITAVKRTNPKSSKSNTPRNFGWIKDPVDKRDFKYKGITKTVTLPEKVDLRPGCPEVWDQGSCGACTAFGIAAAHQFGQIKQSTDGDTIINPSKLFIYYNERVMEGTINEDAGAIIRDGLKTVANEGVCPESEWPYIISKFSKKPPQSCYDHALNHQILSYHAIDCDIIQMKQCLAEGYPFVFGAILYSNFQSDVVTKTGIVSMPLGNQIGGHCMMVVGYCDINKWFIVRNSWSSKWGDNGYCYIPYKYITNPRLCSDFWTIRMVEDEVCPEIQPTPTPLPAPKQSWWKRLLVFFGW